MSQKSKKFLAACMIMALTSCASSNSTESDNADDLDTAAANDQQTGEEQNVSGNQAANDQSNQEADQDLEASQSDEVSPDVNVSEAESATNEFNGENSVAQVNQGVTNQTLAQNAVNSVNNSGNSSSKTQPDNRSLENQLMSNAESIAAPANPSVNSSGQMTKNGIPANGNVSPDAQPLPDQVNQNSDISSLTNTQNQVIAETAPRLTWVGFDYRPKDAQARVEIVAEGIPQFDLLQETNTKNQPEVVVRLYETRLRHKMRRDIDSSEFKSPVGYIRMRQNLNLGYCDVVITLRDRVNPRVFAENGNILLTFQIPDRYYGNSSIGLESEDNTQFLTNFRLEPMLQPGSRLPQRTYGPNQKNFENLPEINNSTTPNLENQSAGGELAPATNTNTALSPNAASNQAPGQQATNAESGSNVTIGAESNNSIGNNGASGAKNLTNSNATTPNQGVNPNFDNQLNSQSAQGQDFSGQQNQATNVEEDDGSEDQAEYQQQGSQEGDEADEESEEDDSLDENEEGGENSAQSDFNLDLPPSAGISVNLKSHSLTLLNYHRVAAVAQDDYELSEAEAPVSQAPVNNKTSQMTNSQGFSNTAVTNTAVTNTAVTNTAVTNTAVTNTAATNTAATNTVPMPGANASAIANPSTMNGTSQATTGNATMNGVQALPSNSLNASVNAQGTSNSANSNISGNSAFTPEEAEHVQVSFDETVGQSTVAEAENLQGGQILRPVRMEFTGAKLGDVLSVLAAENGLNFIFTDSAVEATPVNFRLKDVSWTDALGALLETYGLGYIQLPGRVVRIDRIENLKEQKASIAEIKKQALQVQSTRQMMVRLSYAKAADLQKTIGGMLDLSLDARMKVSADGRTNTLIIEAVPEILSKIKTMIERLDTPTPQVRISARIVEVDDDFEKEFGVKWGTTANLDASKGLGFGNLPFPNSSISRFAVDLPTAGSAGLKFNTRFGHISNAVNLDAALQLSEIKSVAKILQNTSVLVADQQKAVMRAGTVDVFLLKSPDGSVTTKEVEYELKLDVTPSVAADGSVQLTLAITADSEKKSASATADAAKQTKSVTTSLLRKSGETAVIGGVYSSTKTEVVQAVPFLSKIPLIGWFFKNNITSIKKKELLIFVTPTIVASENSGAGTQANYVGSPAVENAESMGELAKNVGSENLNEQSNDENLNAIDAIQQSSNNNNQQNNNPQSNNQQNNSSQGNNSQNNLSENEQNSASQNNSESGQENSEDGNLQGGNGNAQQNSNVSGQEEGTNEEAF